MALLVVPPLAENPAAATTVEKVLTEKEQCIYIGECAK